MLFDGHWDYLIVPDGRFPNEVELPRRVGVDTFHLRVTRNNYKNGLSEEQNEHISERAMLDVAPDYTIDNSGSLDDLRSKVNVFIGDYLNGIL